MSRTCVKTLSVEDLALFLRSPALPVCDLKEGPTGQLEQVEGSGARKREETDRYLLLLLWLLQQWQTLYGEVGQAGTEIPREGHRTT